MKKFGCKRSTSDFEPQNFGRLISFLMEKFKSVEESLVPLKKELKSFEETTEKKFEAIQDDNRALHDVIATIQNDVICLQKLLEPSEHTTGNIPRKSTLKNLIVENVTAIVGLKEAITGPNKFFQIVWGFILIIGIGLTAFFMQSAVAEYLSNPTATKVELLYEPTYEYPSIIICTKMWLDTPKAISLGFTPEALIYGLGYYSYINIKSDLQNITKAKNEFFDAYDQNNFSSSEEFYTAITTDIQFMANWLDFKSSQDPAANWLDFKSSQDPAATCDLCKDPPKKVFIYPDACYMFTIKAEKRGSYEKRHIRVKTTDRSHQLLKFESDWDIYAVNMSEISVRYIPDPSAHITLSPFTISTIEIMPQRFISLKEAQSCDVENYPMAKCRSDCMRSLARKRHSCAFFEDDDAEHHTSYYCNVFHEENATGLKERVDSFIKKQHSVYISDECRDMENCKEACDRTVYTLFLQASSQYPVDDSQFFKTQNMTVVTVDFFNEAVFRDGVFTITEVSTMSFTSMISNLGGTLGLFIGSTMMTLIQIIMFCVKFLTEKTNRIQ